MCLGWLYPHWTPHPWLHGTWEGFEQKHQDPEKEPDKVLSKSIKTYTNITSCVQIKLPQSRSGSIWFSYTSGFHANIGCQLKILLRIFHKATFRLKVAWGMIPASAKFFLNIMREGSWEDYLCVFAIETLSYCRSQSSGIIRRRTYIKTSPTVWLCTSLEILKTSYCSLK